MKKKLKKQQEREKSYKEKQDEQKAQIVSPFKNLSERRSESNNANGNLRYSQPIRDNGDLDSNKNTERSLNNGGNNGPRQFNVEDLEISEQTVEDDEASEIIEEERSRR